VIADAPGRPTSRAFPVTVAVARFVGLTGGRPSCGGRSVKRGDGREVARMTPVGTPAVALTGVAVPGSAAAAPSVRVVAW